MKIQYPGLVVLILASLTGCGGNATTPPPIGCVSTSTVVCTKSGQVQGAIEGAFRAFRGIPFAAPPVGNLRWKPPAAPASWQGIRTATNFGNICPQTDFVGGVQGDEDCLTLNVYASNPPASSKQPVMVFIHGGGWVLGSAQAPPFDLIPLLASNGVIVVTVQYRIGLLGFFAHPLLTAEGNGSSGNYGLMDLIAALKWVHDNIAEFGGDPSRVMMFGQSAGSGAVQALLASPAAKGLFSSAGMESFAAPSGWAGSSLADAYPLYANFAPLVHCDTAADVLACLRGLTADTVVLTELLPGQFPYFYYNIEPNIVPEDPFTKLQQLGSPVPLLIGSNSDEAADQEDPGQPLDANGYAALIHSQFDPLLAGSGNQILSLYPATFDTTPRYTHIDVETDFYTTWETRNLARAASGAQRPAVWRYLFTHRYENDTYLNSLRAFHTAELYFVTGNFRVVYYTEVPYTPAPDEITLSNQIIGYWARFAATGDPNGAGAATWLPYDAVNESIMQLDNPVGALPGIGYRNAQCDFLATVP
jgi:para-nitrobenzyl esterase